MSFSETCNLMGEALRRGNWNDFSFRLNIFVGRLLHHRLTPFVLVGLAVGNLLWGAIMFFPTVGKPVIDFVLPVTSAREVLKVQANLEQDNGKRSFQDYEWEKTKDDAQDPRNCTINQPYTRPLHGCAVDQDTQIPYCSIQMLKIHPNLISGPPGGENLDQVMGRDEDLEFLKYHEGTFTTPKPLEGLNPLMNRKYWYYINDILMSLDYDRKQTCTTTLPGTTLLLTRYEYVDLYHTIKDWWNAYFVLPGGKKADRVIFLDSHAKGKYDKVWQDLFSVEPIKHVNHFTEPTCFENAIFVPPGYSSVLWNLNRVFKAHRCPSMTRAFVDFFIKGFALDKERKIKDSILILDQKPHIIHPRSKDTSADYDNTILFDIQAKMVEDTNATSVQVLDIEKLSFKSQLKSIRRAHILIAKDGPGVPASFFLQDDSSILEIREGRSTMAEMLLWNPEIKYDNINTMGVSDLVRYEVVPRVKDILSPGWDQVEQRYPPEYYAMNQMEEDGDMMGGQEAMDDALQGAGDLTTSGLEGVQHDDASEFQQCALYGKERVSHGCIIDIDTLIPYCQMENLKIDSSRIDGPPGGEPLNSVIGRNEDFEFLKYSQGAFSVLKELSMPAEMNSRMMYHLNDVLKSVTTSNLKKHACVETIVGPTLFVTRYEYVNFYYTLMDWWNTFFTKPPDEAVNLVFLDGHAEGLMDPIWSKVFGKIYFAKQLPEGGVCFDKAIFVPAGYASQLWPRERVFQGKPCAAMSRVFINSIVNAYNKDNLEIDLGRVTILDRVPTILHPRSDPKNEPRLVENLIDVKTAIQKSVKNATTVEIVRLEEMEFEDQITILRKTHVLIGHEGAGMSHLMFLPGGAHVIELQESTQSLELAKWKPSITYNAVSLLEKQITAETIENSLIPTLKNLM